MLLNFISPFDLCAMDVNTNCFEEASGFFDRSRLQNLAVYMDFSLVNFRTRFQFYELLNKLF